MDVKTCLWSELEDNQRPGQVCNKNIQAKFIACELWERRAVTFGVVLYRTQRPIKFNLHLAELQIGCSIGNKNSLA